MAVKSGRVFLLKEGDGTGPPEAFVTVAGLRPTSLTVNGEMVDVSNKDGIGWRDLLPGGAITSMTISAGGVLSDTQTTQENLLLRAIDKSLNTYQLDDGEFILEGEWQITSFEQNGDYNNEQSFSVTLESSGEITKAAVP